MDCVDEFLFIGKSNSKVYNYLMFLQSLADFQVVNIYS